MERIFVSRLYSFFSKGIKCTFVISSFFFLVVISDTIGGVIISCFIF